MPPLPIITDVARVTLDWESHNGVTPANVLHFSGLPGTVSELQTFFDTVLANELFASMSTAQFLNQVTVLKLDGTTASQVIALPTGNHGQSTGEVSPASCTIATHRTPQRGPQGRGRTYVGPVCESAMANGIMDVTVRTTMNAAWAAFPANVDAAGATFVVASYAHADAHVVTSSSVESVLATQRRRQGQLR